MAKLRLIIIVPNVLFMCIVALIYHLSVLDIDIQEICGKHPENSGNFRSQTGFYFLEIFLSDRLWSGECTTGHGNFLRIFLQCISMGLKIGCYYRYVHCTVIRNWFIIS